MTENIEVFTQSSIRIRGREGAIPIHYGSIVGKFEDADTFAENVKEPVKVEIKMQ